MRDRQYIVMLLLGVFAICCLVADAFAFRRCDPPPFVGVTPMPNILIAFDNSASMYDLAHVGEDFCFDDSYDDNQTYYGYYSKNSIYKYKLDGNYFTEKNSSLSCDNGGDSVGVFCVNSGENVFEFKGNFLNWLAMSKMDLVKMAMTGGKYESEKLVGESRGCIGRRFLKQVPGTDVSFAVMGTKKTGGTEQYGRLYTGGTSQIEIFLGEFDVGPCNDIIEAIHENKLGPVNISKMEDCLGYDRHSSGNSGIPAYNTSIHSCWRLSTGKSIPSGNINTIERQCERVYEITSPDQIKTTDPGYVCHEDYVGHCFEHDGTDWDVKDGCSIEAQLIKFCGDLKVPEVIDPSSDLEMTGEFGNVPAMLIDSGVLGQLGPSPEQVLLNRKKQSSQPKGILHELKDRVNMGLMAFNEYGSKFEFQWSGKDSSRYYSDPGSDKDGAVLIAPVEPENEGMIEDFNNLEAYSWTPIGEMLYEATRYFRGQESAYNENVSYENQSPIEVHCQHNAVVLFSDGESTFDMNLPGSPHESGAITPVTDDDFCVMEVFGVLEGVEEGESVSVQHDAPYYGTNYGTAVAYWAHTTDMLEMEHTRLDFYTVFALGGDQGGDLLWDIAKYGGFRDIHDDGKIVEEEQWDRDKDGIPDNFFNVAEPSELSSRLKEVFSRILQSAGSAGAVATVTQQVEGEDVVVRGAFTAYEPSNPDDFVWRGHLESYWPHAGCSVNFTEEACESEALSGCMWEAGRCVGLYEFQKYENIGKFCGEIAGGQCWDAQDKMPAPAQRRLFTRLDGSKTPFSAENLCNGEDWLALEDDEDFNVSHCEDLVNWVRGQDQEGLFREREGAVLGDIVYSTPVVVGQPTLSSLPRSVALEGCNGEESSGKCFYHYLDAQRHRHKMIYVGANDGMLHAFLAGVWWESDSSNVGIDPSCRSRWIYNPNEKCCGESLCSDTVEDIAHIGEEVWAYIPSNLLSELKETARPSYGTPEGCSHISMVDLSPHVYDVFIDPTGQGNPEKREWRTILVGGQRGGGDVYFAVDVTEPPQPNASEAIEGQDYGPAVLWEYSVLRNQVEFSSSEESFMPYLDYAEYEKLKNLPASYSVPGVGRLRLDEPLSFQAALPVLPVRGSDLDEAEDSPVSQVKSWSHDDLSGWVAFITGSPRVYSSLDDESAPLNEGTLKPHLLAIDIEQGVNLFQYSWPEFLMQAAENKGIWSSIPEGSSLEGDTNIPFAISAPVVLDIWSEDGSVAADGYTDHLYFGDINGQFYSIKFHPSENRMKIDVRLTKPIDSSLHNSFRSHRQPITAMPVVSFDPQYNLRAYFGAGKFEDVSEKVSNDMTDTAPMSLYSITESKDVKKSMGASAWVSDFAFQIGGLTMHLDFHCSGTTYKGDHSNWVASDGKPDCGESVCTGIDRCWTSIYDFTRTGERVIGSALVAGELLFVTSFVPETDPCGVSVGESYLYIFDYLARPLKKDPLADSGFERKEAAGFKGQYARIHQDVTENGTTQSRHIGSVAHLGTGMPSQPVLDSSGKYVLVQTSDAEILKIRVNLNQRPFYFKGWVQEDEE